MKAYNFKQKEGNLLIGVSFYEIEDDLVVKDRNYFYINEKMIKLSKDNMDLVLNTLYSYYKNYQITKNSQFDILEYNKVQPLNIINDNKSVETHSLSISAKISTEYVFDIEIVFSYQRDNFPPTFKKFLISPEHIKIYFYDILLNLSKSGLKIKKDDWDL